MSTNQGGGSMGAGWMEGGMQVPDRTDIILRRIM